MMSTEAKLAHANESEKAVDHPMVESVVEELLSNLRLPNSGLPRYGVRKVALFAAQIARAQALGIDPDDLRSTREEADAHMGRIAEAALRAGVPVLGVIKA